MNEKFNKNEKVEQLTKMFLSSEEEKGLIVKDTLELFEDLHLSLLYWFYKFLSYVWIYE